jgi:hypothetical protein
MERIAEKSGGVSISNTSPVNLDIYIKECMHCAHTCRTCADGCAGNSSRFSEIINACLECAKTCESLAKALLLQKQGIKHVRQVQIEASVVACRLCASRCESRADESDSISVCAKAARRCEEIVKTLLPKSSHPIRSKIFTYLKVIVGK